MERRLEAVPRLTTLYGMAVLRSFRAGAGKSAPVTALPADRHQVEGVVAGPKQLYAFQQLMGRQPSDLLPSGYIHVLAFPVAMSVLARPDFPLPLLGMVHLRNEVEHFSPVSVGETLTVTAWVENLQRHRRGTQVDVVVRVEGRQALLWRGRSTYLAKDAHPAAGPSMPEGEAPKRPPEKVPPYPTSVWELGPETGRRYAGVSGDYNPIHLGGLPARLLGMKRPIAHGMYLASRMVAEVGPQDATPFRWVIDFHAPVPLPSRVFLAADVDRHRDGWHGADVTAWDPHRRRAHFVGRLEALASAPGMG